MSSTAGFFALVLIIHSFAHLTFAVATTNPWPVRLTRANPSTPAPAALLDHHAEHDHHHHYDGGAGVDQQNMLLPVDQQQSDQRTVVVITDKDNDHQLISDQTAADWTGNGDQQHQQQNSDQQREGIVEDSDQLEEVEEEEELIVVPREHFLYGQLPELCLLPEQRGTCFGEQLRYRFDPSVGDCVGFFFTGCAANANNFDSNEACARACGAWKADAVCEQAPDAGRDRCDNGGARRYRMRQQRDNNINMAGANVPKWYYDAALGKCALFFWSGCGGNGNRFQSKSECENLCRREILTVANRRHSSTTTDLCVFPLDAGPCADLVTMWYYDTAQHQCRRFTFGGCRGNANRFVSRIDCESQCHGTTTTTAVVGANKTDENANANSTSLHQQQLAQTYPTVHRRRRQRPHLFASPVGILLVGTSSTLTLKCVADSGDSGGGAGGTEEASDDKFTWYKDNREMSTFAYVGQQQYEQRIQFFQSVQQTHAAAAGGGLAVVGELRFHSVNASDAGAYSCAFGALISDPVTVRVLTQQSAPFSSCAGDNGPTHVCRTVASTGLCSTLRYGRYCCQTCAQHNGIVN